MNKLFGTTITNFFTILGTLATLFTTYIAGVAFFASGDNATTSGVQRFQEAAARVVAPDGFVVRPALISEVPNNSDFELGTGKALLVTDAGIPFVITRMGNNGFEAKVNGSKWIMRECKKICVTGIVFNLITGANNANIRQTYRPTPRRQ